MALKDRLPSKIKPYFLLHSYLLSVFVYHFSTPSLFYTIKPILSMFVILSWALFFMVLLVDWRNIIVMYGVGTIGGFIVYYITTNAYISGYIERLPTFILVVIGGCLFKHSNILIEKRKFKAVSALGGSIAHEVRNPLGVMLQCFQMIKDIIIGIFEKDKTNNYKKEKEEINEMVHLFELDMTLPIES